MTIASLQEQHPPPLRVGGVCLVDMGTDFDDFSPRALAFATEGISAQAQANRAHLRAAQAGGRSMATGSVCGSMHNAVDIDEMVEVISVARAVTHRARGCAISTP